MKRFFVIGNGFDRHHGMPTGFNDFRDYVYAYDRCTYEFITKIIKNSNPHFDSNDWNEIETELTNVNNEDYDDILDKAIANAETDMDRASYWNDIQLNSSISSEKYERLKNALDEWIQSIIIEDFLPDKRIVFSENDYFISFNYTETLEILYDVPKNQIFHIHGDNCTEKILGHNEYMEPPLKLSNITQELYDHGIEDDWRVEEAKQIINNIPLIFYKDSKSIIEENYDLFQSIRGYDEVVFMGWSLGPQDDIYFYEIIRNINPNTRLTVVYYSKEDLENFESYFVDYCIPENLVSYVSWEDIDTIFY